MAVDHKALAIDEAQSHAAWDVTETLMKNVSNYQSVLEALRLEPVPIFQTTIDAFSSLPDLKKAILTARVHVRDWQRVGMDLYLTVFMGVAGFFQALTAKAAEITAIVDAADTAKRKLTDAEKASIVASLGTLAGLLKSDKAKIESVKPKLTDFIRLITSDYPGLTQGGQKIDDAIAANDKATQDAALKYLMDQGIMKMILELGATLSRELRAVSPAVHQLESANETAQVSVRDLIAVWTTVSTKYGSVISDLTTAQTTTHFEDLPLLLEIAVASYQELLTYMQGTPSLF